MTEFTVAMEVGCRSHSVDPFQWIRKQLNMQAWGSISHSNYKWVLTAIRQGKVSILTLQ